MTPLELMYRVQRALIIILLLLVVMMIVLLQMAIDTMIVTSCVSKNAVAMMEVMRLADAVDIHE